MPDFSFEDHCCASNRAKPQLILPADEFFVPGLYNWKVVEERTSTRRPVEERPCLLKHSRLKNSIPGCQAIGNSDATHVPSNSSWPEPLAPVVTVFVFAT